MGGMAMVTMEEPIVDALAIMIGVERDLDHRVVTIVMEPSAGAEADQKRLRRVAPGRILCPLRQRMNCARSWACRL